MWCRGVGAAYDILHIKIPTMPFTLDGTEWSSPYNENDVSWTNCAARYGGNWWFKNCSVFTPTTANPVWYNLADTTFRPMKKSRLMVKPQQ